MLGYQATGNMVNLCLSNEYLNSREMLRPIKLLHLKELPPKSQMDTDDAMAFDDGPKENWRGKCQASFLAKIQ